MPDETLLVTSDHPFSFWRTIAASALQTIRPFFKMNGEQSAAWDVVTAMLGGSTD